MGWIADRIGRLAASGEKYALLTQPTFDRLAAAHSRRGMAIGAAVMVVVIAALVTATALMAPRLLREAPLLWFGLTTDARVVAATLTEQGAGKGGGIKYRLAVSYEFETGDGRRHTGQAARSDLSTPVAFAPGETVAIRYDPRDPAISTIEHNLAIDVYALLLFLPFLLIVPGGLCALYLYRWMRWRRATA